MKRLIEKTALSLFLLSVCSGPLVVTAEALAQEGCPTVTGKWQRIDKEQSQKLEEVSSGLSMPTMNLIQEACKIRSREYVNDSGTGYTLNGEWDKDKKSFQCQLTVLDHNKCETRIIGNLRVDEGKMVLEITETNGPCKIPADYKERAVYAKAQ